jgi:hypothetical protein
LFGHTAGQKENRNDHSLRMPLRPRVHLPFTLPLWLQLHLHRI